MPYPPPMSLILFFEKSLMCKRWHWSAHVQDHPANGMTFVKSKTEKISCHNLILIYTIILYFVQKVSSMQQNCLCSCLTACDPKHYGENCTETCTCPSNRCNPITGECQCAPGKQDSPDCSKICTSGTFGLNCRGTCYCQNKASCDPVDGTCYCSDGFQGDKCQHEVTTTNTITTGINPNFFLRFVELQGHGLYCCKHLFKFIVNAVSLRLSTVTAINLSLPIL